VNLGGRRVNKHVELWVKNVFMSGGNFCGFDMTKLIANNSEDEGLVNNFLASKIFFI
jgi:hypothetical protein